MIYPSLFKFDNLFSKPQKKKPKRSGMMRLMDLFEEKEDPFMKDIMKDAFRKKNLERITDEKFGFKAERTVVKYEGEYFKGERNGQGKEFNKEGKLIYEGEYVNGLREGKGKQYRDEGMFGIGKEPQLLYEGEFKNGKWNGKGKQYETGLLGGRLEHEGNFVDGEFVG